MKVYFDLSKKALKSVDLENQTIYTGDIVSTLEVISNQVATTEYVLLSAKLPNAREVGPYLFDGLRVDDATNNTSTWTFTLSRQNGFTLVAGNTTFYLWLIKGNEKKCVGAVNVNVEHAAATGDYSYYIDIDSSDPEETLINMAAQIEQCMNAVAIVNTAISTLGTTKVDKQSANTKGKVTNADSTTEIERTENNYKSVISFLGDVIKSIVKNPSDASAPNTEIKQEDNQIIIKNTLVGGRTYEIIINNRISIFDSNFSEYTPIFQVDGNGARYKAQDLLTEVNTGDIVDRAVTGIKLALNSVGTTHIVDGAITNDKLADDAVDTDNVKDKAITRAKLSQELQDFLNDIVASIPDNSVTTPKIVDGAVTKAKLSQELQDEIAEIEEVIPSDATINNKLVSESTVNDKINSVSAYYITSNAQGDAFATLQALTGASVYYSGGEVRIPTRNDYAIVLSDSTHSNATTRYSYQNGQWQYQYTVNETALTQAQLDALNSGINNTKVGNYDSHLSNTNNPHSVTKAQVGLGNVDNTSDADKPISNATQAALDLKAPQSTTYTKNEVDTLLGAKEDKANKVNSIDSASTNDKYPSAKAVYDGILNYGGAVGVNKALYHLGAYDSADGKTRQTGYLVITDFTNAQWNPTSNTKGKEVPLPNISSYSSATIKASVPIKNGDQAWATTETCYDYQNGRVYWTNGWNTPIYIQYQLATPLTTNDGIIENQSLLPLDTNMANKIRQKVVDGLNLEKISYADVVFAGNRARWSNRIFLKKGIYSISITGLASGVDYTAEVSSTIQASGTVAWDIFDSGWNGSLLNLSSDGYLGLIFRYSDNSTMSDATKNNSITSAKTMLNEGNHPYPYSDFNQKEHITNNEATLLKNEYAKSSNLWSGTYRKDNNWHVYLTNLNLKPNTTYFIKSPVYFDPYITVFAVYGASGSKEYWRDAYSYKLGNGWAFTTPSNLGNITQICMQFSSQYAFSSSDLIMLNKGSQAQPYHDWCGKILHEIDVKGTLLFSTTANTFNAQTLGEILAGTNTIIVKWKISGDEGTAGEKHYFWEKYQFSSNEEKITVSYSYFTSNQLITYTRAFCKNASDYNDIDFELANQTIVVNNGATSVTTGLNSKLIPAEIWGLKE